MFLDVLRELVDLAWYGLPLALSGLAFLDAAHWDGWVWALSGRRRLVWMVLIGFGVLSVIAGLLISGYYLLRIRPALRAIDRGDLTNSTALSPDDPDQAPG